MVQPGPDRSVPVVGGAMSSTAATVSTGTTRRGTAFAVLQRVGRSLMMPIAVLPAAAILLRLGQDDMLGDKGLAQYGGLHWLHDVAATMAAAGGAVFDNLPL